MPHSNAAACDQSQVISEAVRTLKQNGEIIAVETVRLPDSLPLVARKSSTSISYKLDVRACSQSDHAAFYTYRIGAPYQLRANNQLLESWFPKLGFRDEWVRNTFGDHVYNGRVPTIYALPKGTHQIDILLTSTTLLTVGLTAITIGPQKLIATQHAAEYEGIAAASDFVAWASLLIGLAALALFLKRPAKSGLDWFSVGCLLWAFRNLIFLNNIFPNLGFGAEILISNGIITSSFALLITILVFSDMWSARATRHAMRGFAALSVLHLAAFAVPDLAIPLRSVCNLLVASAFIWIAIRLIKRRRYFLALCLIFAVLCGVHDVLMGMGFLAPTNFVYSFWGFTALIVSMAIVSSISGVNALNRAQNSNIELEQRVAEKNAELKTFYDAEQAEQLRAERARLNREIHDGIGAQLMTALRGVERGALSRDQITESLQDGLDELRLLMDSADSGQNLHGALFAWRNRWEPRLNAVELELNWRIADAVMHIDLSQQTILQLIRILQESVANIVKHAKATQIDVDLQINDQTLVLVVRDNGIGISDDAFDASHRGLKHIAQRASLIGASCSIQKLKAPSQGTEVRINLALA